MLQTTNQQPKSIDLIKSDHGVDTKLPSKNASTWSISEDRFGFNGSIVVIFPMIFLSFTGFMGLPDYGDLGRYLMPFMKRP